MAKESLASLLGDNSSFTSMSPREMEYFKQILQEEIRRREEDEKPVQVRDIVDIETWLNSPYYVPDCDKIYPYWKEVLIDIFRKDRTSSDNITNIVLAGSIGTGKSCLNENTRIPTSIGLLTLKDLYREFYENKKRFNVMSESGIKPCVDVYDNGEAQTKKIIFKSGRKVEGTYNHKFRVIRDGKIEWVKFEDIIVGDKTLMSSRDDFPFGNIHMHPDEAYTIGYMVGDGWCEKQGNSNTRFSSFQVMFQYENTEVAKKISNAYYRWFGKKGLKNSVIIMPNGNHMVYLRAFNAKRATKLVESGFGSGSRNKGIPNFIYRCDRETVSNFIQGMFDSDGTAEKDGYTYITMMSEKCIRGLGELLSMFGINYSIIIKEIYFKGKFMGNAYQLAIKGTESYIRFEEEIGFNIDYKSGRLHGKVVKACNGNTRNNRIIVPYGVEELRRLDGIQSLGSSSEVQNFIQFRCQDNYTLQQLRKLYNIYPEWVSMSQYLKYICENDVFFDEVESIEDGYSHTYDLTIKDDHSYCFNGFISHNTVANIMLLRKLYELSCYKNVPSLFHLMRSSSIMFIYFSINMTQAERTGFGFFRSTIDDCPYFKDNFKRKARLDSILVFPENIKFAYGSSASTSIGTNTIASLIDEANFIGGYGGGYGNTERASDLYTSMLNRTASRFIMDGGVNHSLNILVSSSTSTGSVTEQVISKSRDDPHTFIAAPAQWEVKPDKFSKSFFFVCKGTEYLEPHVVHSTDDINNFRISEGMPKEKCVDNLESFEDIEKEIKKLPPHMQDKYLRVPVDLRKGFETNIIRSLQDLGGVSTGSTGKLFTSVSVFNECIDNERFHHPFVASEITVSTGDTIEVKDYIKSTFSLRYPDRLRFIHIDQSYRTDSTGISCVYVDDVIEDKDTGMKKPIIGVDFMLRINPPSPPRKIAIYKIRNFIVWLATARGVKFGKVTYDIFNSEESRQILEEMGFNVGYQSVDRSDKAYLDLVEIMYEGRLKMYDYPILRYELFNLIHYRERRKVDHPKTVSSNESADSGIGYNGKGSGIGSKDVSDALCGAVESLLQFSISEESGAYINNIEDFLYANRIELGRTDFDAMSAEDLIDRQINSMIDELEYSDIGGFVNGTMSNSW